MLKTATFSPAQPWRAKTRLVPCKAAGESKPEEVPTALRGTVRPYYGSWRTEKPLQHFRPLKISNRYVEDFDEPRTTLADVFSILLEHTFDRTAGSRIQFSRDPSGLVRQPACKHRILHRFGHGNGIFRSGNGRIHEYRVRP